jgi:hypothetical protein
VADRLGATTARPSEIPRLRSPDRRGRRRIGDRLDVVAGPARCFRGVEMKHHQAGSRGTGIFTVIAGHFETEWPVMPSSKHIYKRAA